MTALHGFFARWVNDFAADRNQRSAEILSYCQRDTDGLLIVIVILVVVKPF